jgi:hypothetical protein
MQRAMKEAVLRSGIGKRASCHTLRHCFATHPAGAGLRYPDRAGATRACRCGHDDGVHARLAARAGRGAQSVGGHGLRRHRPWGDGNPVRGWIERRGDFARCASSVGSC